MEYKKLSMNGKHVDAGNFVRNLEGRTGTGFAAGHHVHKDWFNQCLSYDDMMETLQLAVDNREDHMVERSKVEPHVDGQGRFALGVAGRSYIPTDHCLQQLATKAGVKSASILREMRNADDFDQQDADTMVALVENSMRRVKADKVFRLRTYTDGTARAFLTDKYAPVDNRWYLETLKEFLPDARFSHNKSDEDTIYSNLLLPDSVIDYGADEDTDYGGMLSIGNCEIGKRRLSQYPSIFRAICMNGCIWGQEQGKKVSKVHRGTIDLDLLKVAIAENIEMQLNILPNAIREFLNTRAMEIKNTNAKAVIAAVAADARLSKADATDTLEQFVKHESHQQNLFGVINAVTRAAQTGSADRWVKMDEIGGQLVQMSNSRWNNILARAATLTDKDFEKTFSLTA